MKLSISFDQAEQGNPSTYSIYKRLANLGLVLAALIIAVNIWFFSAGQDTDDLQAAADQLGRSLITQGAGLAALTLSSQEDGTISARQILHQLAQDPHVRAASLHDARGRELNQAGENLSVIKLFTGQQDPDSLIYVQEILHQGELQGYIKLILDRSRVLRHQTGLTQHYTQQSQVLMLLTFAIGVLLARGFYKLRYLYQSK